MYEFFTLWFRPDLFFTILVCCVWPHTWWQFLIFLCNKWLESHDSFFSVHSGRFIRQRLRLLLPLLCVCFRGLCRRILLFCNYCLMPNPELLPSTDFFMCLHNPWGSYYDCLVISEGRASGYRNHLSPWLAWLKIGMSFGAWTSGWLLLCLLVLTNTIIP